jgi:hypothetical protein
VICSIQTFHGAFLKWLLPMLNAALTLSALDPFVNRFSIFFCMRGKSAKCRLTRRQASLPSHHARPSRWPAGAAHCYSSGLSAAAGPNASSLRLQRHWRADVPGRVLIRRAFPIATMEELIPKLQIVIRVVKQIGQRQMPMPDSSGNRGLVSGFQ